MDNLLVRGRPLPDDLTNKSLANEAEIVKALDEAAFIKALQEEESAIEE